MKEYLLTQGLNTPLGGELPQACGVSYSEELFIPLNDKTVVVQQAFNNEVKVPLTLVLGYMSTEGVYTREDGIRAVKCAPVANEEKKELSDLLNTKGFKGPINFCD